MRFAVIGGSGFESLKINAFFIPRHGRKHTIPPHLINHRKNIGRCKSRGCEAVLSTASVGIIEKYRPGELIVLRDFIAFCSEMPTIFNRKAGDFNEVHKDFGNPFPLADKIIEAAERVGVKVRDGGVIAHTRGPRLETKAEIEALRRMGADVVGMTCVPEAILAREMGLLYGCLAVGCNYACGVGGKEIKFEEVVKVAESKRSEVARVFNEVIKQ
ncbi:MAG: MTAP family purine nucleoside phosphorylase [Candidatus Micrarchaeia archaeon]